MDIQPKIRAYDYVQDNDGWIYLIKGTIWGNEAFVGKAFYSPPKPVSVKCKTRIPGFLKPPNGCLYFLGTNGDYLIKPDKVKKVFPRKELRSVHLKQCEEIIIKIHNIIVASGCKVCLFGSRRLAVDRKGSDWDLLIVGTAYPQDVVNRITGHLHGLVRRYNAQECIERARRYAYPKGHLRFRSLSKIFLISTTYLQTSIGEVGLFFGGENDISLPDLNTIEATTEEQLTGTILPTNGTSYYMPRRFKLMTGDGDIVTVSTLMWELGGIEELVGHKVRILGLRRTGDNLLWLGGPNANLEIVNGKKTH